VPKRELRFVLELSRLTGIVCCNWRRSTHPEIRFWKEVSVSIPVWVLLGFAAWTMVILFTTVGTYRWSRIFTGRAEISEWQADEQQGSDWYRRAIRAHLTCVENLPVYSYRRGSACLTRQQSPARWIGYHDTGCTDLPKLDSFAARTDQ